jgi:hypothetical protein
VRILTLALILAAAGAAIVSWSGRHTLGLAAEARDARPPDGVVDIRPAGGPYFDQTLRPPGFDAFVGMRRDDSRLWLGVAIGLAGVALAVGAVAFGGPTSRIALVLGLLTVFAVVVTWANHDRLRTRVATFYVPRTQDAPAVHLTAYGGMAWDDARLWLGIAALLGVGAVGVSLRRRA